MVALDSQEGRDVAKLRYGLIGTGMMGYEHINNLKLITLGFGNIT